jgi:hypothetical protein
VSEPRSETALLAGFFARCRDRERAVLRLHLTASQLQAACQAHEQIIRRVDAQVRDLDRRLRDERRWSLKLPLRAVKRLLAGLLPR